MSALTAKADTLTGGIDFRFVPGADIQFDPTTRQQSVRCS